MPPTRRVPPTPGGSTTRGGRAEPPDARVAAVLEVLAGAPVGEVARTCSVEPALVHRWVRIFVDAGSARLANQPKPGLARQRDRFLAAFTHELRTPLAVAQGWASVLADGDLPPERAVSTAATLCTALEAVVERTREAELLAAASLGRLRVDRRTVTARTLAPPEADPPAGDPTLVVHTDPDLAGRVVRDLWRAALLEPAPRHRHVELREADPWVELRVVREGEPIRTRVLQALLDPFDHNDDDTGVTTGLYLARSLAVSLGGAVGLEQDAARTVFWLRLPRATRSASADGP